MSSDPAAVLEYDSAALRSPLWEELAVLWRYRDLVQLMVERITTTRYKRSVLGAVWTLLNPLVNMVVLTVAFSSLFRGSLEHYPIYLLSGLICWNFFSQSTTFAMSTLVWGSSLLKRIYLPRTIFAVAAIGNALLNFALSLLPLFAIMLLLGHPIYATWWFVPVAMLLQAAFALGVALLISTLAVFFADVVDMYAVLIQAWFYLTPIMYPREILGLPYSNYLVLNPLYSLIEVFRAPVYLGRLPAPETLLAASLAAGVALVAGLWVFTRKADEFAYRI